MRYPTSGTVFLRVTVIILMLLTVVTVAPHPVYAQTTEEQQLTPYEQEVLGAFRTAVHASTRGPANIQLIDEGALNLPAGYFWVPATEAKSFMNAMGNSSEANLVGLVMSEENPLAWFIAIDFIHSGYIRDDDANHWKPDEMLEQIKAGTEEGNKERVKRGIPALDIVGWTELPTYNKNAHQLVWSLLATERGAPKETSQTVNYNTYKLGRAGYFQLNLVTTDKTVNEDKKHAYAMISSLNYNPTKRYEDFIEGSDKVAEYGLAALVAGVAAKKLGFFAIIAAVLVKAWKIALLGALVFWAKIRDAIVGLFTKKSSK
jgi:uncharacterized membrane-anchored protein